MHWLLGAYSPHLQPTYITENPIEHANNRSMNRQFMRGDVHAQQQPVPWWWVVGGRGRGACWRRYMHDMCLLAMSCDPRT